jgi:dTMP kinase
MTQGWPGFFISFEGLDGAGKSTQVASLAGSLRAKHYDVLTVRPNGTLLGEILHSFVLQHQRGPAVEPWAEALLFTAERVQLLHEVVVPALERGAVVIADRYVDSTLAYQGGGRGVPVDALLQLHSDACDDIWPDLTFYLEVSQTIAGRSARLPRRGAAHLQRARCVVSRADCPHRRRALGHRCLGRHRCEGGAATAVGRRNSLGTSNSTRLT